ncbi:MAG: twin-arginine translocation signal domain-containing protein, partial [Gammaproteobacteria bacterium]|nr:twin-arginine translocation signal domain-containing protein [Gammaproteobacteria bacterium]
MSNTTDISRRKFIGSAAATAGLTIIPGVMLYQVAQAKSDDIAVTSKVRWGMLIDTRQCSTG